MYKLIQCLHGNWILQLSVLPFLIYSVTQTLGLCGVKQFLCKPVYLQRTYISLFPWTQQNSKETFSIFSVNFLSGNTCPNSFFLSFLYIAVLLPFLCFSSGLLFLSWKCWAPQKKWSKKTFFHECQHMPLFWEVTPSQAWGKGCYWFSQLRV